MGLQAKPTEHKTDISLDYLTLGLLTWQEWNHINDSRAQLSASTEQAPSRTCWWLKLPRAEGRAGAVIPICANLLHFSVHSTMVQTPKFSSCVL